jgi:hypothetical protein
MFATDVVKYLFGAPGTSVGHVIEPLADSLFQICAGGDIEQTLVGFGVLHDGRRLPLHGEHHRGLLFFSCLMKSPARRRKVVSDWMSLVMSSTSQLLSKQFLGAINRNLLVLHRLEQECGNRIYLRLIL